MMKDGEDFDKRTIGSHRSRAHCLHRRSENLRTTQPRRACSPPHAITECFCSIPSHFTSLATRAHIGLLAARAFDLTAVRSAVGPAQSDLIVPAYVMTGALDSYCVHCYAGLGDGRLPFPCHCLLRLLPRLNPFAQRHLSIQANPRGGPFPFSTHRSSPGELSVASQDIPLTRTQVGWHGH